MRQKKYWLRGGVIGIIIYILAVLIVFTTTMDKGEYAGFAPFFWSIYFSPIILLGLLFGWLYGKIKNRKAKPLNPFTP
jgi:hypothetical protein